MWRLRTCSADPQRGPQARATAVGGGLLRPGSEDRGDHDDLAIGGAIARLTRAESDKLVLVPSNW